MENSVRKQFLDKIYRELQQFKTSLLGMEKECIYGSSYQIEVYINLYEILVEQSGILPKEVLREAAEKETGILESLYEEWLKKTTVSIRSREGM